MRNNFFQKNPTLQRAYNAFGPVIGALIIDFADLLTIGPLGIFTGPFIGYFVGLWICSIYNLPSKTKRLLSILAAIYCTIPFTSVVPIATIISSIARYNDPKNEKLNKYTQTTSYTVNKDAKVININKN